MKIITDINILRTKSEPVESVEEAKDIIEKLNKALDNTSNGLGLAAIQIGIPKQVGVLTDQHGERDNLINPVLLEAEEETIYYKEGCLSFPDRYINTKRYKQIMIECDVIDGDEFRREKRGYYYDKSQDTEIQYTDNFLCIEVQHEMDHFNGIVFLDHEVEAQEPIKSDGKVGRNDPCPCGSGKKYKKCCLAK